MNKRIILVILSIACLSSSCATMHSTTYEPPKVSFDSTIRWASVDGFRIEMSARMAKQVAEERGYKINSRDSDITFDDVIEAGPIDTSFGPYVFLERDNEDIKLSFNYGRVTSVEHKQIFYQRQQGEELLESYLIRYPQLTLLKEQEKDNFRSYQYKPNRFALIYVSIEMFTEEACRISISVHDANYSVSKRNQETYEEIEAIRRRY